MGAGDMAGIPAAIPEGIPFGKTFGKPPCNAPGGGIGYRNVFFAVFGVLSLLECSLSVELSKSLDIIWFKGGESGGGGGGAGIGRVYAYRL